MRLRLGNYPWVDSSSRLGGAAPLPSMAVHQPGGARIIALPAPRLAQADDAALAAAVAAGDARAEGVLWDRFSPGVRRMLRRTLGPTAEVEALLQEVFLETVRQLGRVHQSAQLNGLVTRVTVRTLLGRLRRNQLRRLLTPRTTRQRDVFSHADAALPAALSGLYRVLEGLDPEAHLAFTLFHFEGLQMAELAQVMVISLSGLKRRLTRANARVRRALALDAEFSAQVIAASLRDAP